MDKPNLLWECITYCPGILFTLEAIKTGLRTSLCYDISHFHYFLESQFGFTNVRDSDFIDCKKLLKIEILDVYSGLFFYMTQNSDDLPEFVPAVKSFNCNTSQVQVYKVPQLTNVFDHRRSGA